MGHHPPAEPRPRREGGGGSSPRLQASRGSRYQPLGGGKVWSALPCPSPNGVLWKSRITSPRLASSAKPALEPSFKAGHLGFGRIVAVCGFRKSAILNGRVKLLPAAISEPGARAFLKDCRNRARWYQLFSRGGGPKTVFFWAPLMKWGLVCAGMADMTRPAEKLSTAQSAVLMATGLIWSRYSLVIIPKNWSLFAVNFFVGCAGGSQLYRIWRYNQELKAKQD
ncbi:mitochondrial pyruvate carrier 2 isoform X1 [Melopsittacus undulatus]|uniref:mitochondrial pyruvate carrier 2 isoform X1 n=1 Tax=Melopsittacus undulatus TaxID=13146 RepID=UPI00146E9663|nr:mitochondrial pyruvate carrier 2 isoform X1 [Melopsittacus undulatus]